MCTPFFLQKCALVSLLNLHEALYTALGKLGYKSYHMMDVGSSEARQNKHVLCWLEGMRAKLYGIGKQYGREEFDTILENYSVGVFKPSKNDQESMALRLTRCSFQCVTHDETIEQTHGID